MARTIEQMHRQQVCKAFPDLTRTYFAKECAGMLDDDDNHVSTLPALIVSAQWNWDRHHKHCGVTVTTAGICHKCGAKIPVIQRPPDWTDLKNFVDPSLTGKDKEAAYKAVKRHIKAICLRAELVGRPALLAEIEASKPVKHEKAPKAVKTPIVKEAKVKTKKAPRVSYWDALCAEKSGEVVSYVQI